MSKLQTVLILSITLAIAIIVAATVPLDTNNDFRYFYEAGRAVLSGQNPYSLAGYFNPIHVALVAAPLSLVPFDLALRLNAALIFIVYVAALYRLLNWRVLWVAMLAPFWLMITYFGNLDAWVLLGVTLPAPIGVWLLLAKPQMGLFAALIMLWRDRDWRLAVAVAGIGLASLALGMLRSTPLGAEWNISLFPAGLIVGVPLLWQAWRKHDAVLALSATAFVSPYMTILNWCVALPLFKVNRRVMLLGVALSWVIFVKWRFSL